MVGADSPMAEANFAKLISHIQHRFHPLFPKNIIFFLDSPFFCDLVEDFLLFLQPQKLHPFRDAGERTN
jgi:hypothetical protein